jgi:hypothetical protein
LRPLEGALRRTVIEIAEQRALVVELARASDPTDLQREPDAKPIGKIEIVKRPKNGDE